MASGGTQTLAARAAAGCFANLAGAGRSMEGEWYKGRPQQKWETPQTIGKP